MFSTNQNIHRFLLARWTMSEQSKWQFKWDKELFNDKDFSDSVIHLSYFRIDPAKLFMEYCATVELPSVNSIFFPVTHLVSFIAHPCRLLMRHFINISSPQSVLMRFMDLSTGRVRKDGCGMQIVEYGAPNDRDADLFLAGEPIYSPIMI